MVTKLFSATLFGIDAKIISIEVDSSPGLPAVNIVGLADTAIKESKERVRSCLRNSSLEYPLCRIAINLSPADIFKVGTQFDLGIALGILACSGQLKLPANTMFIGELSLDGGLKPVRGALAMVLAAKNNGIENIYLPKQNLEVGLVSGINIYHLENFSDLLAHLSGEKTIEPSEKLFPMLLNRQADFKEISGQEVAKRAMEISAAGGHNILLQGPPGSGKTMLARACASILPPPNQDHLLEIAKIQSIVSPSLEKFLSIPFRAPHRTVTLPAFIGGGIVPRPGEISLAHRGVLFLDEFSEYSRQILESLREPLENREIVISRLQNNFVLPADFILIAAQNPCPCGYFGDSKKECVCAPGQIAKYKRKVSGPILDRIDLQVQVQRIDLQKLHQENESSEEILDRVKQARNIQLQRFGSDKLNCRANKMEIKKLFRLARAAEELSLQAAEKYFLSARAYLKIIKVSRTIADLDNSKDILSSHVAEALQYRFNQF